MFHGERTDGTDLGTRQKAMLHEALTLAHGQVGRVLKQRALMARLGIAADQLVEGASVDLLRRRTADAE